jgi:hypothetical protein
MGKSLAFVKVNFCSNITQQKGNFIGPDTILGFNVS